MNENKSTQIPNEIDDHSTFRHYPNVFPEPNDLVYVKIKEVSQIGARVSLLEYANIEGLIMRSEASRYRMTSIRKVLRENSNIVACVLRVDKKKNLIDLSKKVVSKEEIKEIEKKYQRSLIFGLIMGDLSRKFNIPIEKVYAGFGWIINEIYSEGIEGMKALVKDRKNFLSKIFNYLEEHSTSQSNISPKVEKDMEKIENINLESENKVPVDGFDSEKGIQIIFEKEFIMKLIDESEVSVKRRLNLELEFMIKSEVMLYCLENNGVEVLKDAAKQIEKINKNIEIKYVAAPNYMINYKDKNKEEAFKVMKEVLETLKNIFSGEGRGFNIVKQPFVLNEAEE